MKRRTLLKAALAIPGLALLPSAVRSDDGPRFGRVDLFTFHPNKVKNKLLTPDEVNREALGLLNKHIRGRKSKAAHRNG
jgi:hypothetical protein